MTSDWASQKQESFEMTFEGALDFDREGWGQEGFLASEEHVPHGQDGKLSPEPQEETTWADEVGDG